MPEPFITRPGERLPLPAAGSIACLARAQETGGSISAFELIIPALGGPRLHAHTREDEIWYVLEGEFRFKTGDRIVSGTTGSLAFGPRNLPHAFQNIGAADGRLLIITAPAGLEAFFEHCAAHLPGELDLEAIGAASGLHFSGPPLAVSDPL
jgi:mannose-6-phosphate isomerase-like protein (cupin superfamily)